MNEEEFFSAALISRLAGVIHHPFLLCHQITQTFFAQAIQLPQSKSEQTLLSKPNLCINKRGFRLGKPKVKS